ncbi:MAG: PilZ domain-containing protein [Candidatus Thiodiazotropha sp. (ex Monitilora ramsayi)]|nr:PilZ domain-containing protein [Candidatus Thiodiazotropha sp. (ex Monitilora ramsayi)]
MKEQRKSPRKIADEVLEVTDQITGIQIGRVVNISADGLMLLSEEPVVAGSVFKMNMVLPGEGKKVSFRAEAVWSTEATQPNSYWTGLHIIDISPEDVLEIDKLILDWNDN